MYILVLLVIRIPLIAQKSNSTDYLVLISGDTLYGEVKHINRNGFNPEYYKKIRLRNNEGKRKKYRREAVLAFRVNSESYEAFWLSQSTQGIVFLNPRYDINSRNGERYFLKVVSKGNLSHFELEWTEQGDSAISSMDLLKKEEDPFFIRATQGIFGLKRKVLLDYFLNCPDLIEQIERKQLNEVRQIVRYYNSYCLN